MLIKITLMLIITLLGSCSGGGSSVTKTPLEIIPDVQITIQDPLISAKFKPFLLGTNVPWTYSGEGLLQADSTLFNTPYVNKMLELAPTTLRYPGGEHSDYYFWKEGIGPLANRAVNPRPPFGKINFGSKEFLELSQLMNAEPLITVNIVTKDEIYAADWVKQINIDRILSDNGTFLPKVTFWEIGNEPYLERSDPALNMTNAEYILKANAFIALMKAVDPTIKVGIPLRLNQYNNLWALEPAKHADFADEVLAGIYQPIDWIALHPAYRQFTTTNESDDTLYNATMGSANAVIFDVKKMITKIDGYYPAENIPVWITEYNSLYTRNHSKCRFQSSSRMSEQGVT